jgi:hypothetical protein
MAMADPADRQLIDDFVERIHELAQEAVTGQSKFSANELLELAGYRMGTKARRSAFNKVNPFNLFLQESKNAENEELRRPAPGRAGINHGRPSFTGDYQKAMADEYKSHQIEYQRKAKELNEAPKDKVAKGSDLTAHRKLLKKAYALSGELSNHSAHHIFFIVAHSANPAFRSVTLQSDGYGHGFYKIMGNNGCALDRFETMCRGGDILATLQKPAEGKEVNRDGLRAVVRDMIVEHISECSCYQGFHLNSDCIRCFRYGSSTQESAKGKPCGTACWPQLEMGGTQHLAPTTQRHHCEVTR